MSFLLPLTAIPALAAGIGAEAAAITGSTALGTVATGAASAAAGYAADKALSAVVPVEQIKQEAYKNLSLAQKIALIRGGNMSNKEIIRTIKGAEALKGTPLEVVKLETKDFVRNVNENLISGQSLENSLSDLSNDNPIFNYLSLSIAQNTDTYIIPNDPEYFAVARRNDGSVFFYNDIKQVQEPKNLKFYGSTETETLAWYYPEYNTYNVIPPIWGVFTGMNSPNNSLPYTVDGRQSQLDKIAFIHDCMYKKYGLFSKYADYVLINYIDLGLKNGFFVLPGEREKALIAINYFSSLGKVMRAMYGGSEEIPNEPNEQVSIVEELVQETVADTPNEVKIEQEIIKMPDVSEIVQAPGTLSANSGVNELVRLINELQFETD